MIVQTPDGPKPTIPLSSGISSGLATPSIPFLPGDGHRRGIGLVAGRTISFANLYRTQPWVGSSARRLSEQAARLPIHAFEYLSADQDARRRVRSHPVVDLLGRPRPRVPAVSQRWGISLGLKVHGNYVLWKKRPRRGAPPAELWPLDYRLLQPFVDGDSGRVVAWEWQGTGVPGLDRGARIDPSDAVHFAWSSTDGELGISPLEQLGVTLRSEDAMQRYSEASYRHGTRVGMAAILDPKTKTDRATRDAIREELHAANGGVDQAFRNVVLGGGITDLKPIGGQTAAEAELIAQRKVNREEVAAVYGIPQPLAGILDHATYSNIGELLGALFTIYLAPELGLISGTLQAQLVDEEPAWQGSGIFLEHNLAEVLKGDVVKRFAAYRVGLDKGFLTLNDVRRKENEEPYPDPLADEPLVLGNNVTPLSRLGQTPAAQVAQGVAALLDRGTTAEALERELEAALKAEGHNGSSGPLARELVTALLEGGPDA